MTLYTNRYMQSLSDKMLLLKGWKGNVVSLFDFSPAILINFYEG